MRAFEAYQPLKITAEMMAPVIINHYMPLDAILASLIISYPGFKQRFREYRRWQRSVDKYGKSQAYAFFKKQGWEVPNRPSHFLPLAVYGHGQEHNLWVYSASRALGVEAQPIGMTHFNKRLEVTQLLDWLEPDGIKVQTGKGEYKSEHIPMIYTVAPAITWHVNGVKSEIEEMLGFMQALAKKRNRGYGLVGKWKVEAEEKDCSIFDANGELQRPVPQKLLEILKVAGGFKYAFTTYRPPYSDGRWVAKCAVSGKKL